jgi:NAD(P)-dependent dehydrogenase (short-subunit alcohol dehydrogenase family)
MRDWLLHDPIGQKWRFGHLHPYDHSHTAMDLQLQGLTAVVTGGSAGIGAAIVHAFAQEGCNVAFCARGGDRVRSTVEATAHLPGAVRGTVVDVADPAAVCQWLDGVGRFHVFVPNVSALADDWSASLAIDIAATVATTEVAIAHLQHGQHAAITYIGSKASSMAAPRSASYGAAKAAMAHYMKSLSARLLPAIRVNTVSPGDTLVDGGFWDRIRQQDTAAFERAVARNPLGRLATPQEIARVVVFLSSPAASFVAGSNWYVDGGSTQHVPY